MFEAIAEVNLLGTRLRDKWYLSFSRKPKLKGMLVADSILEGSTVQCKIASDLPMLIECLKHLTKSNSTVVCSIEEFGEHIVARTGELHLKISLKGLQDDFMGDSKIIKYDPVVSFRATVLEGSFCTVMRKSLHKHNRLYMEARPSEDGLIEAIDNGCIDPRSESSRQPSLVIEDALSNLDLEQGYADKGKGELLLIELESRRKSIVEIAAVADIEMVALLAKTIQLLLINSSSRNEVAGVLLFPNLEASFNEMVIGSKSNVLHLVNANILSRKFKSSDHQAEFHWPEGLYIDDSENLDNQAMVIIHCPLELHYIVWDIIVYKGVSQQGNGTENIENKCGVRKTSNLWH